MGGWGVRGRARSRSLLGLHSYFISAFPFHLLFFYSSSPFSGFCLLVLFQSLFIAVSFVGSLVSVPPSFSPRPLDVCHAIFLAFASLSLRLRPPPPRRCMWLAAPRRRRPSLVHQRRLRPSVRRLIGPRIDVHVWRRRGSRRRTSSCRARVVSPGEGEGDDKVCFCLKAQLDLFFYIAVSKDLLGHPL